MTFTQAIILAITQGITEFLPISSSGHLVFLQNLFHLSTPPVFYDLLLHFGTLISILIFFQKDLILLVKNWKKNFNLFLFLIIGTVPAGIVGLFLNSKLEKIFSSLIFVGVAWIFFGVILLISKSIFSFKTLAKVVGQVKMKDGLIVGLFQSMALLPGISRAGSTILGGFWQNFSPQTAFTLSFLLAIPAILGANVLSLSGLRIETLDPFQGIVGVSLSALVGFFSLKLLQKALLTKKFYLFGWYCLAIGSLSLILEKFIK
ncbi:MAG: undecaprenyl-diphosphate phosphatase [Patescibacteria group bacterium]|nr:undecaprenyl-diphosphate phosphatase [Patescibacteria group bacterium]